jgi:hypothetical protein
MHGDVLPVGQVFAPRWCRAVLLLLVFGAVPAYAQTLASKARESGCIDAPRVVEGSVSMYRCSTAPGASAFFNVPEPAAPERPPRRANLPGNTQPSPPSTTPVPGLPRVDPATQKGRDELRRKVLQDELAAEQKLLVESRSAYANGAPAPLPEETAQPQRYAERIARLRQAVQLHERNIEALRRELGSTR